jgi:hypothetical protein
VVQEVKGISLIVLVPFFAEAEKKVEPKKLLFAAGVHL